MHSQSSNILPFPNTFLQRISKRWINIKGCILAASHLPVLETAWHFPLAHLLCYNDTGCGMLSPLLSSVTTGWYGRGCGNGPSFPLGWLALLAALAGVHKDNNRSHPLHSREASCPFTHVARAGHNLTSFPQTMHSRYRPHDSCSVQKQ